MEGKKYKGINFDHAVKIRMYKDTYKEFQKNIEKDDDIKDFSDFVRKSVERYNRLSKRRKTPN